MDNWEPRYLNGDGGHKLNKRQIEEDIALVKRLGGSAISFAPGISIRTPGGGLVSCDVAGCNWLMSLLTSIDKQRQVANLQEPTPSAGR